MSERSEPQGRRGTEPRPADGVADEPGGSRDRSGDAASSAEDLGATVAALTADDVAPARRRQLLGRMVTQARGSGLTDLFKPKAAVRWMVDTVTEVAPHVPVRDLATLRAHFPGLYDEDLAERLVRNAARATAGIGAT